jgi:hypothetical protein
MGKRTAYTGTEMPGMSLIVVNELGIAMYLGLHLSCHKQIDLGRIALVCLCPYYWGILPLFVSDGIGLVQIY